MYYKYDDFGFPAGVSETAEERTTYLAPPDDVLANFDGYKWVALTQEQRAAIIGMAAPIQSLADIKLARILGIKREAGTRISALDWKIDRAREQIALDLVDVSALTAVYRERQAIRDASGVAEAAMAALTDVAAIEGFVW